MKKTLFILFATFVCALSSIAADEYTWTKVTANQTDWSGTYLIMSTDYYCMFDGSKTYNSGLTGSGNGVDAAALINATGTFTTTDANKAFTIEAMEGGYSVKAASGEYIHCSTGSANMETSTTPVAQTITWESNQVCIISENGNQLQAAGSGMLARFRYYSVSKYPITLYKLQEASKEMHTITITEDKGTIYITPDDRNVNYAYYVLNATEYNKHITAGRTTANQIFDAQVPLLETADLHKGETTLKVEELLPEGDWYIVAACVKGEDNGNFVQYSRFSDAEAASLNVNNVPFIGCKWNKGTAPWAGTYLLVAEDTEACMNGSLSGDPNTGNLQSTGNMKGTSIFGGEIETDDKAWSFSIEAMEGGYSIKSASGWYIGGVAGKNGITTSQTPLLNTIAEDGTITSEGNTLSLGMGRIMYRTNPSEKVVPYVLTLDTTTEPVDYTKATYTITIDEAALTATVTPSMEDAKFGYIIMTAAEHETHVANNRTTANAIFDAESAMLRGTNVKTGEYTIDLSTLEEGKYYIVVAGVEAEDQIFRTVYHRISEAADADYSNVFEGCKWAPMTGSLVDGKYLLVAEQSQAVLNGALSGDANTGALTADHNFAQITLSNNVIITTDKSMAFTVDINEQGFSLKSASGYYIGGAEGKNGIVASDQALTNTIDQDGNIVSQEHILSFNGSKVMYREASKVTERIVLYQLVEDKSKEPVDLSKETITITVDEEAETFTLTPSNAELPYAYIILTSAEHESYSSKTAEETFEANAALLEDADILTGEQTINIADLEYYSAEGTYYIYAAGVQAEDMGGWNLYKRLTAVATESYTLGSQTEANTTTKFFTAPELRAEVESMGIARIGILNVTTTSNKYVNGKTYNGVLASESGVLEGVRAPMEDEVIEVTATEGGYLLRQADAAEGQGYLVCNAGQNFTTGTADQANVWTILSYDEEGYGNVGSWDDLYSDIDHSSNVNMVRFISEGQYLNGQNRDGIGGLRAGTGAWSFNYVYNANFNNNTTGIGTVLAPQTTTGMFNLQGQRTNANQRGIMILNGKKVLR